MVWGKALFFDATKVEATADLDSLVPRFYRQAKTHAASLFAADPAPAEGPEVDGVDPPSPEGLLRLPPRAVRTEAAGAHGHDPRRPAVGSYRRTTDFRVSPTAPDAAPMQTRNGTALGYHGHYVVDGGKHRIVLAALVTPADVMENVPPRDLLWRVRFRRKLRPEQVTGDTTYGTLDSIVAVEDAGIRAFSPLPDFGHRTPFYGRDAFAYDADRDVCRCPGGQTLRFRKHKRTERERDYQAPAAACNACPLKARCTTSRRGRRPAPCGSLSALPGPGPQPAVIPG